MELKSFVIIARPQRLAVILTVETSRLRRMTMTCSPEGCMYAGKL